MMFLFGMCAFGLDGPFEQAQMTEFPLEMSSEFLGQFLARGLESSDPDIINKMIGYIWPAISKDVHAEVRKIVAKEMPSIDIPLLGAMKPLKLEKLLISMPRVTEFLPLIYTEDEGCSRSVRIRLVAALDVDADVEIASFVSVSAKVNIVIRPLVFRINNIMAGLPAAESAIVSFLNQPELQVDLDVPIPPIPFLAGYMQSFIDEKKREELDGTVHEMMAAQMVLKHVEIPIAEVGKVKELMEAKQVFGDPTPYGMLKLVIRTVRNFNGNDLTVKAYVNGEFYTTKPSNGNSWNEEMKFVLRGIPEDVEDTSLRLVLKQDGTPVGQGSIPVKAVSSPQWVNMFIKTEPRGQVEVSGCITPLSQDIEQVPNAMAYIARVKLRSIAYPVGNHPTNNEVKLTIVFMDGKGGSKTDEFVSAAEGRCMPDPNSDSGISCLVGLDRSFVYRIQDVEQYSLQVTLQVGGQQVDSFSHGLDAFRKHGALWQTVSGGEPELKVDFHLYVQPNEDCSTPQPVSVSACGAFADKEGVTAQSFLFLLLLILLIVGCCVVVWAIGFKCMASMHGKEREEKTVAPQNSPPKKHTSRPTDHTSQVRLRRTKAA